MGDCRTGQKSGVCIPEYCRNLTDHTDPVLVSAFHSTFHDPAKCSCDSNDHTDRCFHAALSGHRKGIRKRTCIDHSDVDRLGSGYRWTCFSAWRRHESGCGKLHPGADRTGIYVHGLGHQVCTDHACADHIQLSVSDLDQTKA